MYIRTHHMHVSIISIDLRRSQLDHCMCIGVIDSHTVIMAVFVDDVLVASTCEDVTAHVEKVSYQGHSEFLNIRITQRLGVIEID